MATVTVEGIRLVAEEFEGYPRRAQAAIVRALNRGMTAGRTAMGRSIAADTGLKLSDVNKALRMRPATRSTPAARLAAGFVRLPLIKFGAKRLGMRSRVGGVVYNVKRGVQARVPSAFIARMRSGHEGVFLRKGRARLPIKQLFGPSLGQVFAKYRAPSLERALEVFRTTLNHELGRLRSDA